MKIILDNNLPPKLAEILDRFDRDNSVRHIRDFQKEDEDDVSWLTRFGQWKSKPVIVSGDSRILANPAEMQALTTANLTFVHLKSDWCRIPWKKKVLRLMEIWSELAVELDSIRAPTLFQVSYRGRKIDRVGLIAHLGRNP